MENVTSDPVVAGTADGVEADMAYVARHVNPFVLHYQTLVLGNELIEHHRVHIRNARLLNPAPTLDREGFLIANLPSAVIRTRRHDMVLANARPTNDVPQINLDYAAELLPLVRELSGARDVFVQDGTTQVRFSTNAENRSWMPTSAFAHFDFTAEQTERLVERTLKASGQIIRPYTRHVLIQTWRVITDPPQDIPLTLCDGQTVSPDSVVPMEFRGPPGHPDERVNSRVCHYAPEHQWYYYPMMTPDEVLVFKGFDSACPGALTALHSAFEDETVQNAVPRGSIECRFVALYD